MIVVVVIFVVVIFVVVVVVDIFITGERVVRLRPAVVFEGEDDGEVRGDKGGVGNGLWRNLLQLCRATPYHAVCGDVMEYDAYGAARCTIMQYDVVWYGMVWYGAVWCGMVRYDVV